MSNNRAGSNSNDGKDLSEYKADQLKEEVETLRRKVEQAGSDASSALLICSTCEKGKSRSLAVLMTIVVAVVIHLGAFIYQWGQMNARLTNIYEDVSDIQAAVKSGSCCQSDVLVEFGEPITDPDHPVFATVGGADLLGSAHGTVESEESRHD